MKTVLLDLDGVLNEYTGEYDKNFIPPMKKDAPMFLEKLSKNYEIKIFTTRNTLLTAKWLIDNNLDKFVSDITKTKDPAFLIIDDRGINFQGNYEEILNEIENFQPWYKR